MNIEKREAFTIISPGENSVEIFYDFFIKKLDLLRDEHIIIDFSENFNTKIQKILLFLDVAIDFRENDKSFVIISKGQNIDEIPDEINIVPTMTEAIDILEMDAIERDLMNL